MVKCVKKCVCARMYLSACSITYVGPSISNRTMSLQRWTSQQRARGGTPPNRGRQLVRSDSAVLAMWTAAASCGKPDTGAFSGSPCILPGSFSGAIRSSGIPADWYSICEAKRIARNMISYCRQLACHLAHGVFLRALRFFWCMHRSMIPVDQRAGSWQASVHL